MKFLLLVGFLCIASVLSQDVIRCKRPICDDEDVCVEYKIDGQGCPTCECKVTDPCKSMTCAQKEVCVPEPEPHCTACAVPECMSDCPFGQKLDKNGCQICECKTDPCQDYDCSEGKKCQAFRSCATGEDCDMEPQCVDSDVDIVEPEVPPEIPCPLPECMKACQFGYRHNEHGCMTCECNTEPCQGHSCPEGSECVAAEAPCEQTNCAIEARCTITPMCKKMKQLSDKRLECDETGTFRPLQCQNHDNVDTKECFCVNDHGDEQEGTRKIVKEKDTHPECYYNRTQSVHVTFLLRHDIDYVETHIGKLTKVIHRHITEWLLIDKEFITYLKVEPHTHKAKMLVVEFEVVRYGKVDLAATAYHLQNHMHHGRCHVKYAGHDLNAEPGSLHMRHTFGPEVEIDRQEVRRCFRLPVLIAAPVGGLLLVGVVIMIIVVNRKRVQRIQRMRLREDGDNFQKNLAFSNELYDQTNILEGDIKKVKLEFTTESNTAQA